MVGYHELELDPGRDVNNGGRLETFPLEGRLAFLKGRFEFGVRVYIAVYTVDF